jgi:hypothetical protein
MVLVEKNTEGLEKERRNIEQAFLLKDYDLKISYLSSQFSRMSQQFNYFRVLECALFGQVLSLSILSTRVCQPKWIEGMLSAEWRTYGERYQE